MLFNSIEFMIFFPIVFFVYWFIANKNIKIQNILLLIASYIFYGWWDWKFLSLIIISSSIDYCIGLAMFKSKKISERKLLLLVSICMNLGFLAFFKYFNFFAESFSEAFTLLGNPIDVIRLNIILPVGISFYTFQTLSYSIDIYRKKLEPTRDIIAFFAFVGFFPQLVAGPIERATNLLPQFFRERSFNYEKSVDGLRQILWGLFKKVVIADSCAAYSNQIFNNADNMGGSTLLLGVIFFAFQIYGDFSGYSDIAIGTARIMGFNLMQNFAFPYFSRDIAEFWRRWHISLSTWFRDYLYIPLGGSKGHLWKRIRNIFIIFIISGFWHGANWTFIIWGLLNAVYFLPLALNKRNRNNLDTVAQGKLLPSIKDFMNIASTFILTMFAWIFFRAESVQKAVNYIIGIFSKSFFEVPVFENRRHALVTLVLIAVFLSVEWLGREQKYAIENLPLKNKKVVRWSFYYIIAVIILLYSGTKQEFIYFQF